ncbi:MAG: Pyruvate synthase subunit PorA [Firmicutes bacterium ADurb.Bin506]|nr:MAG: Pyruvate synthase subunit PorA [Firmicutes bacterium ADurb.Bin506]
MMDRSDSFNAISGPVFAEVRSAMYGVQSAPAIVDYIYGIGGRDVTPEHIRKVYDDLANIAARGKADRILTYLGVRE